MKNVTPRIVSLLLASYLLADPPLAAALSQQQSIVGRSTVRDFVFSAQAFIPAETWFEKPLPDPSIRHYRHVGSDTWRSTYVEEESLGSRSYQDMSVEKFSRILNEVLHSLEKSPRLYKNTQSEPAVVYEIYRALYERINFLIQLVNPGAEIPEDDYWSTVFLAVIPRFQAEGKEVRLGTTFSYAQGDVISLLAEQFNLQPSVLKDTVASLNAVPTFQEGRLWYSDQDRQLIGDALRSDREKSWVHFTAAVQTAFPRRGQMVNEEARMNSHSKKTALVGLELEALQNELPGSLQKVLSTIPVIEEKIIKMRFGLEPPYDEMTQEQVSKYFAVTRARVYQIESKALERLRRPSRSRSLRDYFPEMPEPKIQEPAPPIEKDIEFGESLGLALMTHGLSNSVAMLVAAAFEAASYEILEGLQRCGVLIEAEVMAVYTRNLRILNVASIVAALTRANIEQLGESNRILSDVIKRIGPAQNEKQILELRTPLDSQAA